MAQQITIGCLIAVCAGLVGIVHVKHRDQQFWQQRSLELDRKMAKMYSDLIRMQRIIKSTSEVVGQAGQRGANEAEDWLRDQLPVYIGGALC